MENVLVLDQTENEFREAVTNLLEESKIQLSWKREGIARTTSYNKRVLTPMVVFYNEQRQYIKPNKAGNLPSKIFFMTTKIAMFQPWNTAPNVPPTLSLGPTFPGIVAPIEWLVRQNSHAILEFNDVVELTRSEFLKSVLTAVEKNCLEKLGVSLFGIGGQIRGIHVGHTAQIEAGVKKLNLEHLYSDFSKTSQYVYIYVRMKNLKEVRESVLSMYPEHRTLWPSIQEIPVLTSLDDGFKWLLSQKGQYDASVVDALRNIHFNFS